MLIFNLDHEIKFVDGQLFIHRFGAITLSDYDHADGERVEGPTAQVNERFIYDPEGDSLQPLF